MDARRLLIVSVIVAACLATAECMWIVDSPDLRTASEAVERFHAGVNDSHYDEVCQTIEPRALAGTTGLDCRQFLAYVHQHLGNNAESRRVYFRVAPVAENGGSKVAMNYTTRFAGGEAKENFEWHIVGAVARLTRYHIDAPRLRAQ